MPVEPYVPPPSAIPLDLSGAIAKINRAKEHIANLDAERVRFLGTNTYFGVPNFDVETNRTYFVLQHVPAVPVPIQILLGDAIHNLRSALDHLVWELVRSTRAEPKRVCFPICESAEVYKAESDGKTKGIPESAKKLIDKAAPYRGGNPYLWALHHLDIIDKHRLLVATTMRVNAWSVTLDQELRGYGFRFNSALKTGDVIGDVEGNHESDKQMSITVDIAIGEPDCIADIPMMQALQTITSFVEGIVLHFVPRGE